MPKSQDYIKQLNLSPHPEGGYFSEIYRSSEIINKSALPSRYADDRCFATLIYFLLEDNQISAFHILNSDEIWHHLDGGPIDIHMINTEGVYSKITLGKDLPAGEIPQFVIPRNTWFAAGLKNAGSFVLVGCTVCPGFEFDDFRLGERSNLLLKFPEHSDLIKKFTNI